MKSYRTSFDYLLAELERIDLLILAQVRHIRETQPVDPALQGIYISDAEIDQILLQTPDVSAWAPLPPEIQAEMDRLISNIMERKHQNIQPLAFRLDEMVQSFHLSPFERDALLICLAPELDLRYERLYAYLQDDVTKKRPSVNLILNLLCSTRSEQLANRKSFLPSAPLSKYNLVQIYEDASQPYAPLLSKFLRLDDRIVNYLLEFDEIDARLQTYVHLIVPQHSFEALFWDDKQKQYLSSLVEAHKILHFQGPYGVGKQSTAEALCHERNLKLLVVASSKLLNMDFVGFQTLVALLIREAQIQKAAIYWEDFDIFLNEEHGSHCLILLDTLNEWCMPAFLSSNQHGDLAAIQNRDNFVRVEFKKPSFAERFQLWSKYLDGDAIDIEAIAGKFRLTGGQIRDAALTALNLARRRDPEQPEVNTFDVYAACRLHSNGKLSTLAQKITAHYQWTDIILPADRLEQLQEICDHVRYRTHVYSDWGFDRKLSLGKGLNVLFAGPSGTGKTMAAEIIASELGLDLYKIDLSTVISKYIGETEKNLARIFAEAETSNAILFFDEADALFGKRSEVRDAHDRYANIEIAYLLQKMEEYDGVVILATNLRRNMDDAFVRRMHFAVDFPFPSEHDRLRIWEHIWPAETPLQPDLDLGFMAQRFEVAGGNIRNIALAAAFFAANDGQSVRMAHLIRALKREYQKMGKVVMDGEFGEYSALEAR